MKTESAFKTLFLLGVWIGIMLISIPSQGEAPEFLIQTDDVVRGDP